jgi:hypothetical protein
VPFEAIKGFLDPSVQFGLQFEEVVEGEERPVPANVQEPAKKKRLPAAAPAASSDPAPMPRPAAATPSAKREKPGKPDKPDKPDKPASGGEVVRLDRFRKK